MPTMQILKVNCPILPISYQHLRSMQCVCIWQPSQKKLQATAVLVSFIAANTIHLAIGTRNPFILSILFAFVYYFMREQTEKGKWIGFKEKLAIL